MTIYITLGLVDKVEGAQACIEMIVFKERFAKKLLDYLAIIYLISNERCLFEGLFGVSVGLLPMTVSWSVIVQYFCNFLFI